MFVLFFFGVLVILSFSKRILLIINILLMSVSDAIKKWYFHDLNMNELELNKLNRNFHIFIEHSPIAKNDLIK